MRLPACLALLLALFACLAGAGEAEVRARADLARGKSNWKDAYELYRGLVEDAATAPALVGGDLQNAVECGLRLGRQKERDAVLEAAVRLHPDNWRLLEVAARAFENGDHWGCVIAGAFERGRHRGGGEMVYAAERDRIRALQLIQQALRVVARLEGAERSAANGFWLGAADLVARGGRQAWRLQYLSDLATLPGWDEPYDHSVKGAPVDGAGKPVFHRLPESWEQAASDGERWRWLLAQGEAAGDVEGARWRLSCFLREQFDVHTLQQFGWRQPDEAAGDPAANPWALEGLNDDETIARLANGPRRFTLPEGFRFIAQLAAIAEARRDHWQEACRLLAQTYENRRHFTAAVPWWTKAGTPEDLRRASQITGAWGTFETAGTQPAGTTATLDFRFRNAAAAELTARPVDVDRLLADVQAVVAAKPSKLNWEQTDLNDIGRRLVAMDQVKYLGGVAKSWSVELKPKPGHADRRISIAIPQLPAGAWLVESQVAGGNASRVLLWLADLALVKKPTGNGRMLFWTVDAQSGVPVAGATIAGFGWRQRWEGQGKQLIDTTVYDGGLSDGDGLLLTQALSSEYQWVFIARQGQRRAFLGWSGVWSMDPRDDRYDQVKTLVISDRPAYRPGQVVKCSAWTARTRYDAGEASEFAGRPGLLKLVNPRNETIATQQQTYDRFGGVRAELALPADAGLGAWQVILDGVPGGSVAIRVEEYKKPEFAVTVAPPTEPVVLGGKLSATISATYYFGAPVAEGTVKYRVLRRQHDSRWYPEMPWDWLYGNGYWWFEAERPWFPGWRDWGCRSPRWAWWYRPEPPPEQIADGVGRLAADGTFTIEIDSGPAKLLHGDADHRYEITAEVTDGSRRTITGSGTVIAARTPFAVTVWADRGWIATDSAVEVHAAARTPDGKPVAGEARVRLLRVSYAADGTPTEREVSAQKAVLDADGRLNARFVLAKPGQYRCAVTVVDGKGRSLEGATLLSAIGQGSAADYRFNDLELTADKREYASGEQAQLLVGVSRPGAAVLLFDRPVNGIYSKPRVLRLDQRQALAPLAIATGDMPNCYVEALTVHGGKEARVVRELVVPPASRALSVAVVSDAVRYKPGATARLRVKVSDPAGAPVAGALAVTMYDEALEYISGGPNVPEIRAFFWKWRRQHQANGENSLNRGSGVLLRQNEEAMQAIGCFGLLGADDAAVDGLSMSLGTRFMAIGAGGGDGRMHPGRVMKMSSMVPASAPVAAADTEGGAVPAPATVRTNFADAAFWSATLVADAAGMATIEVPMPENLTAWKLRVWAMAPGTRVGEASTTLTTAKDLLVRLQAPRFFQERDEVVLSANVHNYLPATAECAVAIDLPGSCLELLSPKSQSIRVAPGTDQRVDWRVKVVRSGEAVVRLTASSEKESDALEQKFPVKIHGAPIQVAWSRVLRPDQAALSIPFTVPAERRPETTRLEVRWSPTLAGALVDALPYLASNPHGSSEATLDRFLPTVICQRVLKDLKVDLAEIRAKRANLNAQELGDAGQRAAGWQRSGERHRDEPVAVWDDAEVAAMARHGVARLQAMQLSDGGWGWFSGWGEHASAHMTSLVVRGLIRAKGCGTAIDQAVLDRGVAWLQREQAGQVAQLELWKTSDHKAGKAAADSLDALVDLALAEAGQPGVEIGIYLWRDAAQLPPSGKALHGLACQLRGDKAKVAELRHNLEQFLKQDEENQTAWLELPEGSWWWSWSGDAIETQAAYLKLLAASDPANPVGARLVKYLLNNRKHATWWNSTRDTALVIDAMADWLTASGEDRPDCTVEVLIDGRKLKEVRITAANMLDADLGLVVEGATLATGEHRLELRRSGTGPLYANAYLGWFSLAEGIAKQGLEVKVERAMYRLVAKPRTIKVQGAAGKALDQQVAGWERQPLADGAVLTSGDLIEVELTIESKNDYEYLVFTDPKVAGCEPFNVRSGYLAKGLHAYAEWRDDRSCLFVDRLPRGRHSLAWRMRAEIPGAFHALPTQAEAVYAPELRANADELRLEIRDPK